MLRPPSPWLPIVGLLFFLSAITPDDGFAAEQRGKVDATKVSQILRILDECPLPTKLPPTEAEERQQLLSTLQAIGGYPTPTVRAAVKQFMATHWKSRGQQSKVFLLNRCVFAVPEVAPKDALYFDSWAFKTADPLNYMCPLALDSRGEIAFVGSFSFYIGPPYRGLAEFDYFEQRFGRRRMERAPVSVPR